MKKYKDIRACENRDELGKKKAEQWRRSLSVRFRNSLRNKVVSVYGDCTEISSYKCFEISKQREFESCSYKQILRRGKERKNANWRYLVKMSGKIGKGMETYIVVIQGKELIGTQGEMKGKV